MEDFYPRVIHNLVIEYIQVICYKLERKALINIAMSELSPKSKMTINTIS